mgnify:CR=1 FL=1
MGVPKRKMSKMKKRQRIAANSYEGVQANFCKNCGEPTTADPTEIRMLGLDDKFLSQAKLMKGRGCSVCGGTGYKGRVGIYEIFMLTDEMQDPEEATRNGFTPISTSRVTALGASLVCSVENTR